MDTLTLDEWYEIWIKIGIWSQDTKVFTNCTNWQIQMEEFINCSMGPRRTKSSKNQIHRDHIEMHQSWLFSFCRKKESLRIISPRITRFHLRGHSHSVNL